MKSRSIYILIFLLSFSSYGLSQIPDRPVPPRLVNDFAGMLNGNEVRSLEQKLVAFNDSTSTQIAIVTVSSLEGYDKAQFAQELAEKWGIGQKGLNNGLLILIKPNTGGSKGQVQISPGYGLEGVIPDITCAEIVDRELLPSFRNGNYYGGLDRATSTIMALASKEYTADEYGKHAKRGAEEHIPLGLIIFIVIIIIAVISRNSGNSNNRHISTGGLPFWMLMSAMNSRHGSGGWGGFSGGGGGGGGFGGFGGGSFGGGGAGGSW
jgi:uncharacterized protein